MEVGTKHDIRVTCIQPGAVATELYEQITDPGYRQQMDDLAAQMTFLQGADIANTHPVCCPGAGPCQCREAFLVYRLTRAGEPKNNVERNIRLPVSGGKADVQRNATTK
jgi:NAD(P)-dependent dehydrogenase (short-subunit alcohol dehydrogenase family)